MFLRVPIRETARDDCGIHVNQATQAILALDRSVKDFRTTEGLLFCWKYRNEKNGKGMFSYKKTHTYSFLHYKTTILQNLWPVEK